MLVLEAGDGAAQRLAAALDAAPVAAVVITAAAGRVLDAASAAPLVAAAQNAGAAAQISGDARLARTLKADGIHLPASATLEDDFSAARELISPRFIVGVDAGNSRHDAMTLGEAGADYIGFSLPETIADREAAATERLELVAWWAEIFEVPCVAFDVATIDEARVLAEAGVDFVAIRVVSGTTPTEVRDRVAAFGEAVAAAHASANS